MSDTGNESRVRPIYKMSACLGKQKLDRATANRVVRETKKVKLHAYRCRSCRHWHVGSVALKMKKAKVIE